MNTAISTQIKKVDSALGAHLFTFAVIADSHLNPDEDVCNAPFDVNRLANGRMRRVVQELNASEAAFVIHLGDLIHPVPAVRGLYKEAADRFHEQVAELRPPLHLVPGNHDVGDKPLAWSPAGEVNEAHIGLWKETFGDHYYAFDRDDCHFIVLNAQIMNTGMASEQAQREWLEGDLAASAGKRIFINIHYPPFICREGEEEHYDNIAEPARAWLLDLMEHAGVEALFGGHVHNFWYLRHRKTDCYLLPSTAFVRQDYSEMLKAPPSPESEAGRNDAPKLGYFLVAVYEHGHACHNVRTYGRMSAADADPAAFPATVPPLAPRENARAPLGFDLRERWAEPVGIPPSGGLDEFDRKVVRNDYPLLALWEMGIRRLRVPLQDLRDPETRSRMADLTKQGHEFTLFTYGIPEEKDLALIAARGEALTAWEIGFTKADLTDMAPALKRAAQDTGLPLYLSMLWSHGNTHDGGTDIPYYHVINHGFTLADEAVIREIVATHPLAEAVRGVVFRACADDNVWETVHGAAAICQEVGFKTSVHLRMRGENPAAATRDDRWAANRVAEALAAAACHADLTVFVDTLVDIDRGYFVRNGVIDSCCNPRLGARVIQHLTGALKMGADAFTAGAAGPCQGGRCLQIGAKGGHHLLFLPAEENSSAKLPLPEAWRKEGVSIRITDLASGEIRPVTSKQRETLAINAAAAPVLLTCREK